MPPPPTTLYTWSKSYL